MSNQELNPRESVAAGDSRKATTSWPLIVLAHNEERHIAAYLALTAMRRLGR
jgi:hypothetical protein